MHEWAVPLLFLAALSACEQSAPPSENVETVPVTTATIQPGLYSVGDDTTAYGTTRLNEDGTYIDYGDDREVVGGGTWRTTAELICFDPEGDGENELETCWTNEPAGDDGSFRTTTEDGEQSYIVTPIADDNDEPSVTSE